VLSLAPLLVVSLVVAGAVRARPRPARLPVAPVESVSGPGGAPPLWFHRLATAADLAPVERWWQLALAAPLAAGLVGTVVVGVGVGGGAMVLLLAVEFIGLNLGRRRAAARLARSVPDALDSVARSCRAGSSVVAALGELDDDDGPAGPVLADVAVAVHHGVALRVALDDLVAEHPEPAMRLAAAALLVAGDTGAAPARAVEGVAATLRDHAALEREAAGHATQAQASAAVLVVAPVGFGLFAVVTDPRVAAFLFGGPVGWSCLILGAALDALGAWWMSRLVRNAR
jgi:tight adherence protein B